MGLQRSSSLLLQSQATLLIPVGLGFAFIYLTYHYWEAEDNSEDSILLLHHGFQRSNSSGQVYAASTFTRQAIS